MKITKKQWNQYKHEAFEKFVSENGWPFNNDLVYLVKVSEGEKVEIAVLEKKTHINNSNLSEMGFSKDCRIELLARIDKQRKVMDFPTALFIKEDNFIIIE